MTTKKIQRYVSSVVGSTLLESTGVSLFLIGLATSILLVLLFLDLILIVVSLPILISLLLDSFVSSIKNSKMVINLTCLIEKLQSVK